MQSRLTRRSFNHLALSAAIAETFMPGEFIWPSPNERSQFTHPGLLHSKQDLARMREGVKSRSEPIIAGFQVFKQHPCSQSTYTPRGPVSMIGRNPTVHVDLFDSDSNAAYQCAIVWCITGDYAYADTAIRILNGWTSTLEQITGADAVLCASLGGFKLINAAELIRYTDAGWTEADVCKAEDFFRLVLVPVLKNFAPFANGNWDTAAIKCILAAGIFVEDGDLVDDALRYYLHGCGNGRLRNYIYPGGQCQESGRDQQHTQLGLAHMGDTCEMAWNQGLDLYGALANRLLDGFEYAAKYNLGLDVPFTPDLDKTGKYSHSAISPRGSLRPVYEQIYNHFTHRRNTPAPYLQLAAETLRPEGAANGADHTGFGTLLYSRSADSHAHGSDRIVPASLYSDSAANGIRLDWIPSYLASTYSISRKHPAGDQYRPIASGVVEPSYVDRDVTAGHSYSYRVQAAGILEATRPQSSVAGLPHGWSERSYGEAFPAGCVNVTPSVFAVQAYGSRPFDKTDELHFVFSSLLEDGELIGCLSPLLASQQANVGLMFRLMDTNPAPMIALSISPDSMSERPRWTAALLSRETAGDAVRTLNIALLDTPFVTYGRIVRPIWMRLSRKNHEVSAGVSDDGQAWTTIGKTPLGKLPMLAGYFACSGLGSTPTEVTFEHVSLRKL